MKRLVLLLTLLLAATRVEATPIALSVAIDYYTPAIGFPASLNLSLFETSDTWPAGIPAGSSLAVRTLSPGVSTFTLALDVTDLALTYLTAYGQYQNPVTSIFVAEPPTGHASDALSFGYGPPWLPVGRLMAGASGDLTTIYGYSNQADGAFNVGKWSVTPVPEPSTLFMLGTGLLSFGAHFMRRKRTAA